MKMKLLTLGFLLALTIGSTINANPFCVRISDIKTKKSAPIGCTSCEFKTVITGTAQGDVTSTEILCGGCDRAVKKTYWEVRLQNPPADRNLLCTLRTTSDFKVRYTSHVVTANEKTGVTINNKTYKNFYVWKGTGPSNNLNDWEPYYQNIVLP